MHLLVLVEILGKHLLLTSPPWFPLDWYLKLRSPCHIRMYKTNINIFHKQILIKYYNDNSSSQYVTQASTFIRMQIILPVACFARGEIIVTNTSLLLTATGLPPRWWKTWWCSSAICDCWETCLLCEKPTCFALFDFDLIFNIYVLTSANQFWFEKTTFGLPASGSGSQMSSESYSSSFGLCVSVFLFFCLFACLS